MDGFAVAAEVAGRPALAGATVMMLSSSGDRADQLRCAEVGIAAYLTKPVYASDLLAAIRRALSPVPAAAAAPREATSHPGTLAGDGRGRQVRILLVEDNSVNQRVAAGLLTRRGHHVTVAPDGREALDRLDREVFDLVLMDLQMPVMDGLAATLEIRRREQMTGRHIRIVAMTAHAMRSDRERCLAAGMDGYLSKPIDPPRLFAAVEEIPAPGPGTGTTDRDEAPAAVSEHVVFDVVALRRRLSGDEELMTEVIRLFLDDLPMRLAAINDAVTRGDAAALRASAHALKGAAGNLSAVGLFDAARALERIGADSRLAAADAAWRQLSVEAGTIVDVLRRHSFLEKGPQSCAS
jgi:CheY-like chemotaxis protein